MDGTRVLLSKEVSDVGREDGTVISFGVVVWCKYVHVQRCSMGERGWKKRKKLQELSQNDGIVFLMFV